MVALMYIAWNLCTISLHHLTPDIADNPSNFIQDVCTILNRNDPEPTHGKAARYPPLCDLCR